MKILGPWGVLRLNKDTFGTSCFVLVERMSAFRGAFSIECIHEYFCLVLCHVGRFNCLGFSQSILVGYAPLLPCCGHVTYRTRAYLSVQIAKVSYSTRAAASRADPN